MSYSRETSTSSPMPAIVLGVIAFAAVMAVVAVTLGVNIYKNRTAETPEPDTLMWVGAILAALNAAVAGYLAGRHLLSSREAAIEPQTPAKLLLLIVGGVLGFSVVFLGFTFVYQWWDQLVGGRSAWKEWKPWLPVGLIVGGLGVMFFSLVAVRSEERSNASVRRLIYGYNAFLTGLLVLAILGVGNVMAFFYGTHPFDWTATNIYSITPTTKRILSELDRPVKVHALIMPTDPLYADVENLLTTAKSYSPKLEVEYVNSRHQLTDLINKYELTDGTAMLVVMETDGKTQHHALRGDDLEDASARMMSQGQQRSFKGEQALMSAISYLRDNKANQTIYFTQDSGEMKLSDASVRRARGVDPNDRGIGSLKARLEKSNYTVKEWQLGALDEKTKAPAPIPDDAFALVMVSPISLSEDRFAAAKIKVLEDYMKRPKSRMLVLLEMRRNRQGEVQPTGLEGFMQKFGVQVGKDIIMNILPDPTMAIVKVSAQGDPGFRSAFPSESDIPLSETRSIRPIGEGSPFSVTPLLEPRPLIRGGTGQWAEENLKGDPVEYLNQLQERGQEELRKKLLSPATPVAVTVRDKSANAPDPNDPHAFMRQNAQTGDPRMVVFGSAGFAANSMIEGGREIYYNLFSSALGWLRDRPDLITDIQPKERKAYRLSIKPEDSAKVRYWPAFGLLVGLTVCGVGVWLSRRR